MCYAFMQRADLTKGSIAGNIFGFAVPYMLAYFLQILYGLADLFVIGRYCGVESTTAVSNGAQVMYMFTVVIIGLAMGTTVRTARAVGAKNPREISRIIGNTITLFALIAFVMTLVLLCLRREIVEVIKTPPEAVDGTLRYLTICFTGIPFIVAYNIIASVFRGLGDTKNPMYFVAVACLVNIVLDFLFIGALGMGPMGAALATVISQAASVCFACLAICGHGGSFKFLKNDLLPRRKTVFGLLNIGIPVALQDGFIQVAFIAITVIANARGIDDAAAVGIVEKFIGLLFIVPSAMLSSVSAISAQNIGAGNIVRAKLTMRYAMSVCVSFGLAAAVVLQFVPECAVAVFTDSPRVITLGGEYLKGYVWDCIFAGIHFCFSGFFTACGYSSVSFAHNFVSIVCARIPLSYLASEAYPDTLYPMGLATPAGSLVSVFICIAVYLYMARSGKFNEASVGPMP